MALILLGCVCHLAAVEEPCELNSTLFPQQHLATNILTGTVADVTLDDVMGGTSTGEVSTSVTLDNVMGGTSTGSVEVAEDASVLFEGYCDLTSGGFAILYFDLPERLNMEEYDGFMIEVSTLPVDLNRAAPLAFGFDFISGGYSACSAHSSFAVPIAESVNGSQPTVRLYMDAKDFRAKGQFYTYFGGYLNNFISGYCDYENLPPFMAKNVRTLAISITYQEGPYSLNIHSVVGVPRGEAPTGACTECSTALPAVPLSSFGVDDDGVLISSPQGAADLISRALDRTEVLIYKGTPGNFGGVGSMEMYSLSLSVLTQAVRQAAATDGLPCSLRELLLSAANTADEARASDEAAELYFALAPSARDLVVIFDNLDADVQVALDALLAM